MKLARFFGVLLLVCVGTQFPLQAREHPPVVANAPETTARQLQDDLTQGKKVLVIDVRSPKEYAEAHVPGSINIPLGELSKKIAEMKVSKDTTIVTLCEHGGRASRAVEELRKLGYNATSYCKLDSWKREGYKTEKGS